MLFGEDQGRYLLACDFDATEALLGEAARAAVPLAIVGRFGGDRIVFGGAEAPRAALSALFRTSFADALA